MNFLPLAERELRVVSRRKGTYWIRCGAALLSFLFLLPALALAAARMQRSGTGASVFNWMKWYGVVTCALAGVFLGADSIAEERREGTLGFLFLTNLKSHDVVLGKFLGASLNAFYGLLAMIPVLALCVLGGGVTGGEFWRTSVALVNTLFFSTALAILISARVKSENRPTLLALGLILGVWIGGEIAFQFSTTATAPAAGRILFWLSMASPGQAFSLASAASYLYRSADFWRSLAVSNAAGWVFLGMAAWRLDFSIDGQGRRRPRERKPRDRKLLESSPIAWLLDDSAGLRIGVWLLAGLGSIVALFCGSHKIGPMAGYVMGPFYFLLKVLFATRACYFFAEGRRSGALELLRTTPLAGKQMITEQWVALRRIFLYPLGLLFLGQIVATILPSRGDFDPIIVFLLFYKLPTLILDFFAIGWCGMWIALVCRKPSGAVWLTIVLLVLAPMALLCVPSLLIDAILIRVARDKVEKHFAAFLAVRREETGDYRAMVRGQAPVGQV